MNSLERDIEHLCSFLTQSITDFNQFELKTKTCRSFDERISIEEDRRDTAHQPSRLNTENPVVSNLPTNREQYN